MIIDGEARARPGGSVGAVVERYSTAGVRRWRHTFAGDSGFTDDRPRDISIDDAGTIWVPGIHDGECRNMCPTCGGPSEVQCTGDFLVALAGNGSPLGTCPYQGSASVTSTAVAVVPGGGAVVVVDGAQGEGHAYILRAARHRSLDCGSATWVNVGAGVFGPNWLAIASGSGATRIRRLGGDLQRLRRSGSTRNEGAAPRVDRGRPARQRAQRGRPSTGIEPATSRMKAWRPKPSESSAAWMLHAARQRSRLRVALTPASRKAKALT